jgi:hypothetical protein
MKTIGKALLLLVATGCLSVGTFGCNGPDEAPPTESASPDAEHPKGEHPEGEHPEGEHPEGEHPKDG